MHSPVMNDEVWSLAVLPLLRFDRERLAAEHANLLVRQRVPILFLQRNVAWRWRGIQVTRRLRNWSRGGRAEGARGGRCRGRVVGGGNGERPPARVGWV